MSTRMMALVWPLQMPPVPKSVLVSLADNANDAGECWPSLDTIAKRTCVHRASVIRAIATLEQLGHVSADRSSGRHTRYLIHPVEDLFEQKPVAQRDLSQKATGSTVQPVAECNPSQTVTNPSQSATGPVAQCDSNRKEPKATKSKSKEAVSTFVLPDWIRADIWAAYLQTRKKKRAASTDFAFGLVITELIKLRAQGHEPNAVLESSIRNGWTDVYPVKEKGNANDQRSSKLSVVEQVEAAIDERNRNRERAAIEGTATRTVTG